MRQSLFVSQTMPNLDREPSIKRVEAVGRTRVAPLRLKPGMKIASDEDLAKAAELLGPRSVAGPELEKHLEAQRRNRLGIMEELGIDLETAREENRRIPH